MDRVDLCAKFISVGFYFIHNSDIRFQLITINVRNKVLMTCIIHLRWIRVRVRFRFISHTFTMNLAFFLRIYYSPEVRRGKYWALGVFLLQYFPLVSICKILQDNCTDMNIVG